MVLGVGAGWLAERLTDLERRLADAGRDRREFHAAVKIVGVVPEELDLLPDVVGELASIGFDEVVVDPMWRDLDESATVVRQCKAALS